MLKLIYSSKNVLGVYLNNYFKVKKTSIFGIFLVNRCRKPAVFALFLYIPGGLEGLFDFYDSLHHHPQAGHSPHQAVLEQTSRSLALSKCRWGASDYGRCMTKSLPLSPEKSYTTSTCTATSIYIAARFRVKR
jgi:hypothetical protein